MKQTKNGWEFWPRTVPGELVGEPVGTESGSQKKGKKNKREHFQQFSATHAHWNMPRSFALFVLWILKILGEDQSKFELTRNYFHF